MVSGRFSTHTVLSDMDELVKADKALMHPLYFAFVFYVQGFRGHQLIKVLAISPTAAVRAELKTINIEEKSGSREQVGV